jgi:hypothetical protein
MAFRGLVYFVSQKLMSLWLKSNLLETYGAERHVIDGVEIDSAEHINVRRYLALVRYASKYYFTTSKNGGRHEINQNYSINYYHFAFHFL